MDSKDAKKNNYTYLQETRCKSLKHHKNMSKKEIIRTYRHVKLRLKKILETHYT